MSIKGYFTWLMLPFAFLPILVHGGNRHYSEKRLNDLKEKTLSMFYHGYESYLRHASGFDELRPLTCDGIDTWGSYSLTLIDALDTLATIGNYSEFGRVSHLLEQKMDFDKDINVSVFETTIRIVGGLLAAHLQFKRAGMPLETGWPCQGPLLRLAEDVARRLLPAFDTATGMPYGTVNLRYGVPKGETAVTCTAGVGTFLVEFGALSRLTGNPIYEEVAMNAVYALWERRSSIGLFGNHIDVQTGRWTALDSGIGAGVDSFFEYLVKGSILLNRPELLEMFHEARYAIDKYLKRDDWYVWAGMNKGQVTLPVFQSLESFWPGLLSMIGDTGPAIRTMSKYSSVWRKYGFLPEFFNIPVGEASVNRESYPLRPELVESAMYLYRATKNQFLLELGEDMLQSIEFSAKTKCGYATIRNVVTHEKENRMESFFLAETTKYLYLLFDTNNYLHGNGGDGELLDTPNGQCVIHAGAYIFNTEAHPIDMSALYCCHDIHEDIYDGLDLEHFKDDVILKAEREKSILEEEENPKYQCAENTLTTPPIPPAIRADDTANVKKTQPPVAVDIEVYDENNNPAGDILVDNFDRIKKERQTSSGYKEASMNQLTVNDLEEFFEMKREHFTHADKVLDYVVTFMQNYTLDASYISGLQLFDKNISSVLGAAIQEEYEESTRTLWELYELQQQNAANLALVTKLGILAFDDENRELLESVLRALNHSIIAKSTTAPESDREVPEEDVLFKFLQEQINSTRLEFVNTLVNTTAMQEFLLRILINGTMDKKRTFKPLLNNSDISSLPPHAMDVSAQLTLFHKSRRIVEIKKRMIETFDKLQALMADNGKQQQQQEASNAKPTATTNNDDLIVAMEKAKTMQQHMKGTTNPTIDSKFKVENSNKNTKLKNEPQKNNEDSVWAQLVQTILRKTTIQRSKFDEELLLEKTRKSLQKYQRTSKRYDLFTCQKPRFIEKFAYREFYP